MSAFTHPAPKGSPPLWLRAHDPAETAHHLALLGTLERLHALWRKRSGITAPISLRSKVGQGETP